MFGIRRSAATAVRFAYCARTLNFKLSTVPSEDPDIMRARLLYQSRKRGIRENDLLLSSFANIYLDFMTPDQLKQYDNILNAVDNEWDLYKYMVGSEETPEFLVSEVMSLLKSFASNPDREQRLFMPELKQ